MTVKEAYAELFPYIVEHGLDGSRLGYWKFVRFKHGLPLQCNGSTTVISKMVIGTEKDKEVFVEDRPLDWYAPSHLDRIVEFLRTAVPYRKYCRKAYCVTAPEPVREVFGTLRLHGGTIRGLRDWKRDAETQAGAELTWDAFFAAIMRGRSADAGLKKEGMDAALGTARGNAVARTVGKTDREGEQ